MGQLLLIQGTDVATVERLFRDAVRLFKSVCGLNPSAFHLDRTTAVAKFGRLKAAASGIVRDAQTGDWICGAGTFFFSRNTGDAALKSLLERLTRGRESVLANLDGMFALARSEPSSGILEVITDRLGTLHIYKAEVDSCIVISTSSLVLASLLQPPWDPVSCREFLANGNVFGTRTLFQGIEKLAPASVIHYKAGREVCRTRYWSLAGIRYTSVESVPRLACALEDVFRAIERNFSRPVLDLTGGFDSRVLAGVVLRSLGTIDTFVTGAAADRDVIVSQQIAREFGFRHHHLSAKSAPTAGFWELAKAALLLCDGEYDVFEYARILDLQRRLAEQFDIEINGSNGELCKGYWWELLFPFTGRRGHFNPERIAARRFAFAGEPAGLLRHTFPITIAQHFADVIRAANAGLEGHPNTAQMDNVYLMLRMQRWQGRIASASNRMLANTSPFMFREPMEIALSTPPPQRLRNRLPRRLIEHLSPSLAALPLSQGYPALPVRLTTLHHFGPLAAEIWRKAYGKFAKTSKSAQPCNVWKELWAIEEIRELLNPKAMASASLYEPDALASFLEASKSVHFGQEHRLRRVITLELLAATIQSAAKRSGSAIHHA